MIAPQPTIRTRRRSRAGRVWVIVLLVLAVVLVAADRIGVLVADSVAANAIRSGEQLSSTPTVRIRGVPFLTQLARRRFGEVDVTVRDLLVGTSDRHVVVGELDTRLHDVTVSSSFSSGRAGTVDATAHLTYAALSTAIGVPISYAGPTADGAGRISARKDVTVLGQDVTASVTAEVSAASGGTGVRFLDPQVSVGGGTGSVDLPSGVVSAAADVLSSPVRLDGLPFGGTLRSVTAGPAGVTVSLSGSAVSWG